jgi:hypothetical protein
VCSSDLLSVTVVSFDAVVDGDAAAEGVEAGEAGVQVNVGEAGAEEATERGGEKEFIGGAIVGDGNERGLEGEVCSRRGSKDSPVGVAGGAEGEEILKARQATCDQPDQLGRQALGRRGEY